MLGVAPRCLVRGDVGIRDLPECYGTDFFFLRRRCFRRPGSVAFVERIPALPHQVVEASGFHTGVCEGHRRWSAGCAEPHFSHFAGADVAEQPEP